MLGVQRLVVNELHEVGSARGRGEELRLESGVYERLIDAARPLSKACNVQLQASRHISKGEADAPWTRWAVSPAGDLKLCQQSVAGLETLASKSDSELQRLDRQLRSGAIKEFRDQVDNCSCFEAQLLAGASA